MRTPLFWKCAFHVKDKRSKQTNNQPVEKEPEEKTKTKRKEKNKWYFGNWTRKCSLWHPFTCVTDFFLLFLFFSFPGFLSNLVFLQPPLISTHSGSTFNDIIFAEGHRSSRKPKLVPSVSGKGVGEGEESWFAGQSLVDLTLWAFLLIYIANLVLFLMFIWLAWHHLWQTAQTEKMFTLMANSTDSKDVHFDAKQHTQ